MSRIVRVGRRIWRQSGLERGHRCLPCCTDTCAPFSRAARLGADADRSRQRAAEARRAGERHRAAGGGGRRLSRGADREDARARAAPVGETQIGLGSALLGLGQRESGTARLEEAVAAYRVALTEQTRERVPLAWAMTQLGLGSALRGSASGRAARRGWRRRSPLSRGADRADARARAAPVGEDAARSRQRAAEARRAGERHRAAGGGGRRLSRSATERTRERVPLQWAETQISLGNALESLGERESGTARLEEAVAAYRAALTEWTRERAPYYWAWTQENLAIVFQVLATRAAGGCAAEIPDGRSGGRGRRARGISRG